MLTIVLIGLAGGLITGISPCVLPVLPVLFFTGGERRTRPFLVVAGLTLSFSLVTLLGTLVVDALPIPADSIHWAGLALLVVLGIAMIFPRVESLLERPFAALGRRQVGARRGGFVLGLALGAVYVPCAGPVLAAITVAGATGHIGWRTVALTLAFAVGTAVPLLVFALAGSAVADRVRVFRDRQRGVRVVAGVVVLGLAVALGLNVTDALQRDVPDYVASANHALDRTAQKALQLGPAEPIEGCAEEPSTVLQNCGTMPALKGLTNWINSSAITKAQLAGKVVLVDFWAYSCINCQREIPHVEAWYRRYHSSGLEVIGVHTPEYAFERVPGNVASGVRRLGITYPVALDNGYDTWNDFHNESWPASYLIDSTGHVRHVAIGEGEYPQTETLIRQLLQAAHPDATLPARTDVADRTPTNPEQTAETYLGAERAEFDDNGGVGSLRRGRQTFSYPSSVPIDRFALTGTWTIGAQAITAGAGAGVRLTYNASQVYLDVGGSGTLTVTADGRTRKIAVGGAPDIYTVASSSQARTGTVTVALSPGLQAYSFTFG